MNKQEMAMSNETDLDWLARNVRFWRNDSELCIVYRGNQGQYQCEFSLRSGFTKAQWLARRAELQNKPSWNDSLEWAEWLAQDADGEWFWYKGKPGARERTFHSGKCSSASHGLVIGDWRDTLEKRPEEFKPSIEEANGLAQEFKPFISIEDNQEQEMKRDKGWFERGELPPVGIECEMKRIDGRWCKAVTVGKDSGGKMVCELNDNGVFYASTSIAASFRPIRTERDELIGIIASNLSVTTGQVADAIIAAGFKLEVK